MSDVDALARMLVDIDGAVAALPWWTAFRRYALDEESVARLLAMGDVARNVLVDMAAVFEGCLKKDAK